MRVRVQVTKTTFYSPTAHSSGNIGSMPDKGARTVVLLETVDLRFMRRRSIDLQPPRRSRTGCDLPGKLIHAASRHTGNIL